MKNDRKRLTIGVLVSGITDDFTKDMCRGIMTKAEEMDVNLVVLPGKYLDRDSAGDPDLMYEYQNGTILSYATKDMLDGVIIAAGCIGCMATEQRIEEMVHQYDDIPCVLAVTKIDGYAGVNFDNFTGIQEGLNYLIESLHYDKIGMVGGPDDNMDAFERKNALRAVLEAHGIAWEDKRYVQGDLSRSCTDVMEELLDRNPDLQAIFCVNDETAVGLYSVLEKREILPGRDISVMGFDNTDWAKKACPSLSTVMADASEIGSVCLIQLMRILDGETVESNMEVPTRFVKRESFNRPSTQESNERFEQSIVARTERYFEDVFYRYKHDKQSEQFQTVKKAFYELMECMDRWADNVEYDMEKVEQCLDGFLNKKTMQYIDTENILAVFDRIYEDLLFRRMKEESRLHLGELFAKIYEKAAHMMNYNVGIAIEKEYDYNMAVKMFVRNMLQFDRGSDQSYGQLLGKLDWMKIRNAYIFIYENPIMNLEREMFVLPEYLYLKAVQRGDEVIVVSSIEQKVKLADIYSEKILGLTERHNLVLLPLFFNEMLYGVLLCDLTEGIFENGEFLSNQMSAAVKMIELLKSNEDIQQRLEESMATLRENNIVLDTLSKSDGLTGIRNRRGFDDAGGRMCEVCKLENQFALAVYVDMNNLKIINDRYGHDEGDFSLKTIGDILVKVIGREGVVGRIGGDEFACILPMNEDGDGQELLNEIYSEFKAFNLQSDRPYNITVSAGAYMLKPTDELSLEQALALADERLYEVKKLRSREVAKSSS